MKKQGSYIIQFICIVAVLVAILVQGYHPFVEMKPLYQTETPKDWNIQLNFKNYLDGSYQRYMTGKAKRMTGFREFFIRNYNQVVYSCFGKSTNTNIKQGRKQELYLTMYLNEITGQRLKREYAGIEEAKADAQKNVEATLRLIDTLQSHGTRFLFVFAPSKTGVYPEYMPKYYRDHISDFSLEEYYIELFKQHDIPHIDFLSYFRSIKADAPYPLYTRTGTHWAEWTIPFVADTILRKLEEVADCKLPKVKVVDDNFTTDYSKQDIELETTMNLPFPLDKPALPRPVCTLTDTLGTDKPNLLVVGDSYFVQLKESVFTDAFRHWDYWMYNKDSYSSRKYFDSRQLEWMFDAAEVLEDADIVMAVFTNVFMYDYMAGFTQSAQELFAKGTMGDQEALLLTMEMIKADAKWYQAVVEQAKERGISVEENLRRNAKYTIETNKKKKEQTNP